MSGSWSYRPAPRRAEVYGSLVLPHVPRLLGHLDRQPGSASFGSFDRDYWGWKFRDFPITMLQASVCPLAYVWRFPLPDSPYHHNPRLLRWIEGALDETCRHQRDNGSFDSVAPNTADHGASLAMAFFLWETGRLLGDRLSAATRRRMAETVKRACAFGLESEEDHAFITNHQALFALGFRAGHEATGREEFRKRAEKVVETIIDRQHRDGWYEEYGGFDPGYQTLAICYLARYWVDTRSAAVLDSLRRAVAHLAHAVHPDGSLGGVYGSRHTSLYAPAGLERLASELPTAAAIARFMRERLPRGNVVTPGSADVHNLPILAYTYLAACLERETRGVDRVPQLPCQKSGGVRSFGSGLTAVSEDDYYAVAGLDRGGVIRVFDRSREELCYEDAGYLVRSGSTVWASQIPSSVEVELPKGSAGCRARVRFSEVREVLPTPARFLLLRVLNLTLFRSRTLGRWIQRWIVRRMITQRKAGPVTLDRKIWFEADAIRIRDELMLQDSVRIDEVVLPRSFTAFHMGSAKYFQQSDLTPVPRPEVTGVAEELGRSGRAVISFKIGCSEAARASSELTRPRENECPDPDAPPGS